MSSPFMRAGVLFGHRDAPPPIIPASFVARFMDTPQHSGRGPLYQPETDLAVFLEPRFMERMNPWGNDPLKGSCAYFHGGSALFFQDRSQTSFSTSGSWTMEFFISMDEVPEDIVVFCGGRANSQANNSISISFDPSTNLMQCRFVRAAINRVVSFAITDPATFFNGDWHHIAAQRNGAIVEIYVDGVVGSVTHNAGSSSINDQSSTYKFRLNGAYANNVNDNVNTFTGYMDEFRFTELVARYPSGNFTPPDGPHPRYDDDPYWSNVLALVSFDEDFGVLVLGETANIIPAISGNQVSGNGTIGVNGLTQNFNTGLNARLPVVDDKLDLGTEDFTYEIFTRVEGHSSCVLLSVEGGAIAPVGFAASGPGGIGDFTLTLRSDTDGTILSHTFLGGLSRDMNIAIVREGDAFRIYLEGELVAAHTSSAAMKPYQGATMQFVPAPPAGGSCYMRAIRIVRGHALYSGPSYTLPDWQTLDVVEVAP